MALQPNEVKTEHIANGIISLFNPATRTIRVRAPRTGQYTYAIVYLLGYIK